MSAVSSNCSFLAIYLHVPPRFCSKIIEKFRRKKPGPVCCKRLLAEQRLLFYVFSSFFSFCFLLYFSPPPSCVRTYMSIYIIRFVNKFTHTHRISLGEIFDRGTLVAAVSKFVSFAIFLCNVRQVGISVDCGFLCGNSQSSEILKERNSIPRLLKGWCIDLLVLLDCRKLIYNPSYFTDSSNHTIWHSSVTNFFPFFFF